MNVVAFRDISEEKWDAACRELRPMSFRHSYRFLDYLERSFPVTNISVLLAGGTGPLELAA